mmetsp:Transcript_11270/g.16303  ORF Transcript_11270/g.16303 Transcript_11270/m.16303 type:complete len:118 (-) Transcript_11270:1072-1425(-)
MISSSLSSLISDGTSAGVAGACAVLRAAGEDWAGAAAPKLSDGPDVLVETPAVAADWLVAGSLELDRAAAPNEKPWAAPPVDDVVPDADEAALVVGAAPNESPGAADAADDAAAVCV